MTREIKLTRGQTAIVDDADYDLVGHINWQAFPGRSTYYAQSKGSIRMHRIILGAVHGQLVDHIDGNGLNNTRANIRLCTNGQNVVNSKRRASFSSKFKGVQKRSWVNKRSGDIRVIWRSGISTNGKRILLGHFKTEIEAAKAYDAAAKLYHGEFARTNF